MAPIASTAMASFPHISGYTVTEQLYEGPQTAVYSAVSAAQQPVVIKILRQEYPTFNDLVHFKNQYEVTKTLPIANIIRPLSLERWQHSYALVMEDFGGISLQQYAQAQALPVVETLSIAVQLSTVLHELCQHQVVHKDIKPANILIHPTSKRVKLIDFSIASLLPKSIQERQNPHALEGTLAYLAPEQTGRMNRGIDYRTDFYGFGVTLYELLTGELPFRLTDPLELVHCHIAKIPPSPDEVNPAIPSMVSQIVLKLLAKNAEDRYQSALGIQHDLEQCLMQWKETGSIATFELGQQDVSDRFLIPEKLYGRESEVEALLEAFERTSQGRSEMMLVAGFSGIGKTAVVNEIHKPITHQKGYFIKGKFDQFNRNIPLSAFVQALRNLMGQLLSEADHQVAQWRAKILEVVGENGQVLIEVVPELEQVIGKQPVATELSGNAATNRFNLLFQKFIEVFSSAAHPLVMFLDDLQWADLASLQLLKLLMNGSDYLLILGAYRDNEVSPTHPFILTVEELTKAEAAVETITLAPLAFKDTNHLIADTLNCSKAIAQPLSELIEQKTQGNPFFTTQFLKALHDEGCLHFEQDRRYWECDIVRVNTLALTDDVVKFMALRLQKLPDATQQALKLAACIDNQFDLATLAIISEQSLAETAAALWQGLQEGLILPTNQVYRLFQDTEHLGIEETPPSTYRFLHDRVQQAAYSLIPNTQKQSTHLEIGQLLLTNTAEEEIDDRIFDIVNQLNKGIELIDQPLQQEQLAQLNFKAGNKAKISTAYAAATDYFNTSLRLLVSNSWDKQYDFTLELHEFLAEADYLNTSFESSEKLIQTIIKNARTSLDKARAYEILIQSYTSQNRLVEAIEMGREALSLFGVEFPQACDFELMNAEHQKLKALLGDRPIDSLVALPTLSDDEQVAVLRILAGLFASVYLARPDLLPLNIFEMVKICIQHGNGPKSAIAYSLYGLFLCASGDVDQGYQFGQLGTTILDRFQAKDLIGKVNLFFGLFVKHWKTSIRSTLPVFMAGLTSGLETGDLEYVGYCANCYTQFLFWAGEDLGFAESEATKYCDLLQELKQEASLIWAQTWRQTVINLRGNAKDPILLKGPDFNELEMLPHLIESKNVNGICYIYLAKLLLSYSFGDYPEAIAYADKFETYEQGAAGLLIIPLKNFYQSLSLTSLFSESEGIPTKAELKKITENQKIMKTWAHHAPMNYLHKFQLVEAEIYRLLGENYQAGDWYDRAISEAKANNFTQEEALANELAAKFYLAWGREKVAAGYMQEAHYGYSRWGAQAKTHDLETRYPTLLKPILQKSVSPQSLLKSKATIINPKLSINAPIKASCSTTSINDTLDLTAVLRASQGLSSNIHLDELLRQLTTIILQNSGGDLCSILLPDPQGKWQVKASATAENFTICSAPLDNNPNLPSALIQYVKNTQEAVIIEDLKTDLPVIDDYLKDEQPSSILCLPLFAQGNVIGILYLSNQSASGVFTENRLITLNLLCTQTAISLENARLYQQAQTYAEQLEQSQLQTVQSEKMAALGNLVAGVAHEINNPIGFLNGSIRNAQNYVQDLQSQLDLYQQHYPDAVEPVQENAEEIDLDFVSEDLPKLLSSMQGATDRIKAISTSLRTFSRADTEHKVSAHLHEGLDSTLLILKYRLKANETRPAIEVCKEYEELPAVECFPGRLNQVFMNLLANAIDVFDEAAEQASFAERKDKPQTIMVKTALLSEQNAIEIRISDNGKGMPEAVRTRIFDHLFTTKGVGKGTGLGLAIARQIITEAHGGSLDVQSVPGQGTEFCIRLPL